MALYGFKIEAEVSPSEVIDRVQSAVRADSFLESLKFWRFFDSQRKPFVGKVGADSFIIRRDIWYRNSFLPRIRGRVEASLGGSEVSVTMSLHPVVTVVFCLTVALSLLSMARTYSLTRTVPFSGFAFVGFLAALAPIAFIPEAKKAKKLLTAAAANPVPRYDETPL